MNYPVMNMSGWIVHCVKMFAYPKFFCSNSFHQPPVSAITIRDLCLSFLLHLNIKPQQASFTITNPEY